MWVGGVTLCHMTSCTHLQDCVRDRPSDIVTEASCKGERDLLLHFHACALSAIFSFLPDLQSFNFLFYFFCMSSLLHVKVTQCICAMCSVGSHSLLYAIFPFFLLLYSFSSFSISYSFSSPRLMRVAAFQSRA